MKRPALLFVFILAIALLSCGCENDDKRPLSFAEKYPDWSNLSGTATGDDYSATLSISIVSETGTIAQHQSLTGGFIEGTCYFDNIVVNEESKIVTFYLAGAVQMNGKFTRNPDKSIATLLTVGHYGTLYVTYNF